MSMKSRLGVLLLLCVGSVLLLCGCRDPGNEPVKDGKTINSDRAAMEKMYKSRQQGGQ